MPVEAGSDHVGPGVDGHPLKAVWCYGSLHTAGAHACLSQG